MQPITLLVKYQYDALNRLIASSPLTQDATQRFYLKAHLVTEIQGTVQRSIMQHGDQLLAQQQRQSGTLETGLLATDPPRSVLNVLDRNRPNPLAYTPYGHRPLGNGLLALLGFNGERLDPVTGWYLLGIGHHRPFNPVLGRFICPDSWSPFGDGGLNTYAYCAGDPLNRSDPTGHAPAWLKVALRRIGLMRTSTQISPSAITREQGQFRNPMARSLHPHPNSKTPAWTTQDRLAFAGTESRHPGAPRSAISQESLATFPGDTPNASPQPRPRTNRMGNIFETGPSGELVPLYGSSAPINSTSSIGSLPNNHGLTFDPPPPYSAPLPPPNYGSESLPTYQQATANRTWRDNLSKRQSSVRRGSQSTN